MKRITIQSVADSAGVSKATVSRALNDTGYVQEDIKKRIFDIANELGYHKSRKTKQDDKYKRTTIAVVFPSISADFFGAIIDGISSAADELDIGILLFSTQDNTEKEEHILKKLQDLPISGLVFIPVAAYKGIEGWNQLQIRLDDLQVPVVLVDRSDRRSSYDSIVYDNYNGAYLLGEQLLREGYTKIGAIIGDTSLQLGLDRLSGFSLALKSKMLSIDDEFFYTHDRIISPEMAYSFTIDRIHNGKLPDAVFLSNSLIANGFLKALFENKLVPGEDVRCVGFDSLEIQKVLGIQYTYLDRETFKTGQMAVQMIVDRLNTHILSKREFIIPAKMIN